jgi:hypothetical protein
MRHHHPTMVGAHGLSKNLQGSTQSYKTITHESTYTKIGRYLSQECSKAEAEELEIFVREDSERLALLFDLRKLWETTPQQNICWNTENSWLELDALIDKRLRVVR